MQIAFVVVEPDSIEPFGVMSLVPHLIARGFGVRLFDADDPELLPRLEAFNPRIVGYSVTTGAHTYYLQLNAYLKERLDFLSVFGGPHPTFFPDMLHRPGVDAIARGECDYSFALFCEGVRDHGQPRPTPNFTYHEGDHLVSRPPAPLIEDLDALPFPSREAYYSISPKIEGYTVRSFLASRGCPFHCTYCFNHAMDDLYGGTFCRPSVRSIERVVTEICAVTARYPTEFLAFRESIFPLARGWLERFGELMRERVRLPFYCHLRLDMVTKERAALLARAGCHSVNVGIETGRYALRKELLGRPVSDETIVSACETLKEAGITILANNMLGLPFTTFDDDWATLQLNQRAAPHYSLAMLYQPYPGTRLAAMAQQGGWFHGDMDALEISYYERSHGRYEPERERRPVENLQRLFAVAARLPALNPLWRRLVALPRNKLFGSIFKTAYLMYHQSEIFPHTITPSGWVEHLRGLLE